MTEQAIIEQALSAISHLPYLWADEILHFVAKRYEEQQLLEGIQRLTANSRSFGFLQEEEDLYSETDLKEVYNA